MAASPHYLGFDCGTQSIRATVLSQELHTVAEVAVNFDDELPAYGTSGGCHRNGNRVTAPVIMWVESVEKVPTMRMPFARVCCIASPLHCAARSVGPPGCRVVACGARSGAGQAQDGSRVPRLWRHCSHRDLCSAARHRVLGHWGGANSQGTDCGASLSAAAVRGLLVLFPTVPFVKTNPPQSPTVK